LALGPARSRIAPGNFALGIYSSGCEEKRVQLTQYTDYSLRVLIYLARFPDRAATIGEIADYFRISRNHLMKVVSGLASALFVQTSRGKGGGLQLARPAHTIMVGEVVRAMEPDFRIAECFDATTAQCAITKDCGLKGMLYEARRDFLLALDRYTVAEAAGTPPSDAGLQ
jgi:Rrf2 family nitric oxide-sensitive transcriptional repressor